MARGQWVLEKIAFHHAYPCSLGLSGKALPRHGARPRQIKQSALQCRVAAQDCDKERPRAPADIQHAAMTAEIVIPRERGSRGG